MQMTEPETITELLTWLTTGGGAVLTAVIIWMVKRFTSSIDRLHDRVDELEREVLVLQTKEGMDQTVFTSRAATRRAR